MARQKPLEERSITELRAIAQGCGAYFDFSTDRLHLMQAIREKAVAAVPQPKPPMPVIEDPDRLRFTPPAKNLPKDQLEKALQPYIARGLRLSFPAPNQWAMEAGKKTDSGNMRAPLRVLVQCAERVLT